MTSCKDYKKLDSRRTCYFERTNIYPHPNDSAIEASNKELERTIKKGRKETRATIPRENIETRETLRKIAEEFQKALAETKFNEACESRILKKIKFFPVIKDY